MRHGVEGAGHGHRDRQADDQFRIVDHDIWANLRVIQSGLHPVFGLPEDRRRFRPCVGCGNDDLRQARSVGDGLAEVAVGFQFYGNSEAESYGTVIIQHTQPILAGDLGDAPDTGAGTGYLGNGRDHVHRFGFRKP